VGKQATTQRGGKPVKNGKKAAPGPGNRHPRAKAPEPKRRGRPPSTEPKPEPRPVGRPPKPEPPPAVGTLVDAATATPEAAARAALVHQAFALRKAGASYRAIGAELHVSAKTALEWVREVLTEVITETTETAEEIIALELERLDAALVAISPDVRAGNLFAVDRLVRLSESRRKLLGADKTPAPSGQGTGAAIIQVPVMMTREEWTAQAADAREKWVAEKAEAEKGTGG
jgi:hypothetical protein